MTVTSQPKRPDPAAARKKARESRLRRLAGHRGFVLRKSRRQDPAADDFDIYYLVDERGIVIADCEGLDGVAFVLEDIARRDREGRLRIRYA
jgi:hypothetical protein